MSELPNEYTISLWFRPSGSFIAYGRDSNIANFFDLILLSVTVTNEVRLSIGDTGSEISPTYASPNDQISTTEWNYIAVSVKTTKSATNAQLDVVLSIAPGRDGTLVKAGEVTQNMPTLNDFVNLLFLGSKSNTVHDSFDGYLKEIRMFSKFHSFDQLTVDKLKIYKEYAYDDPNIIAHWKLDEAYNSSSSFYTLNDYSLSRREVTVYLSTNPDHPSFVYDVSRALNL